MQLIQITSIPIEYRLRITNAKLELVEMEKNGAKNGKDAYEKAAETASGSGIIESIGQELKTPIVKTQEDADKTDNNMAFLPQKEEDIAVKLASEYDAENIPILSPEEQFVSKIKADFEQMPTVPQYIEKHNFNAEIFQKNQSRVNIKLQSNRYDNIVKTYREMQEIAEKSTKKALKFVPGEIEMEVITKPKVEVKYIGGFQYVPPETDPNYKEPFYEIA